MAEKLYTEEEVERLLTDQTERLEARHFEEKTEEVLAYINTRLKEANGYKATIGKDLREVKEEVQDIKRRVISVEIAREEEVKRVKEESRLKHQWYQDWWVRAFGMATILWEIINVYQAAGGSIHHVIK